jgi:hypothetical protein
MCVVYDYVNSRIRCHAGRLPKHNKAVQALYAAAQLRDGVIHTTVAATVCCGISMSMVRAAADVLKTEDDKLALRVLRGQESLLAAAAGIRIQVQLAAVLKRATPEQLTAAAIGTLSEGDLVDLAISVETARNKASGTASHSD